MKIIDIDNWKRKKHFAFYKDYDFPLFSISVNLDISNLIEYIKSERISFFPTFLYLLMRSMNSVDELKYRIRGEQVVLHETITPSYTVLNDDDLYVFSTTDYDPDYQAFIKQVKADIEESKHGDRLEDIPGRDDLVFVSMVPWISFTHTTHPIDTKHPDSFPRLTMGKYCTENGITRIPICIYAHHGLCDGLHIARFLKAFEKNTELLIDQKI